MAETLQTATLAGGCFWCLEAVFRELEGVHAVVSGYTGGSSPHPTYAEVCTGKSGHAEAVQVRFDPAKLSYHDLLTIFFTLHDPTTLNRQGFDIGPQYRSAVFYHDGGQEQEARRVMAEIEAAGIWPGPLVTELTPLSTFTPAEEYHQAYFEKNPFQPYCRTVVLPKVVHFREKFARFRRG